MRFITEWRFAHIQSINEKESNLLEVIVDLEEIESAAACILACGGAAKIISPDELRAYVHKKVKAFSVND